MCGVVLEQCLEKLGASLLQTGDQRRIGAFPVGEGGLVIGEGGDTRPRFFVGGAKNTRMIALVDPIVDKAAKASAIERRTGKS